MKRILMDISNLIKQKHITGIQRVIFAQAFHLLNESDKNFEIRAIHYDLKRKKFFYCDFFFDIIKNGSNTIYNQIESEKEVSFESGDIYYTADFLISTTFDAYNYGFFDMMKKKGIKIIYYIHDLIPIKYPMYTDLNTVNNFKLYILTVLKVADKIICNSNTTKNEVIEFSWLVGNPLKPEDVYVVYPGFDFINMNNKREIKLNEEDKYIIEQISKSPFFIKVSTIEPRKGHYELINAFHKLWNKGLDYNLVLVGKYGWMAGDVVKLIYESKQKDKKLFWLGYVSDDLLYFLYRNAIANIMASRVEGFGLSVYENLYHNKPLILRNIPVFREIAGDSAFYFPNTINPKVIANYISDWIKLYEHKTHPNPCKIKPITWKEHSEKLLEIIFG